MCRSALRRRAAAAALATLTVAGVGGQARAAGVEYFDGPTAPSDQAAWLANLTAVRAAIKTEVNYSTAVYDLGASPWLQEAFLAPQVMAMDAMLWSRASGTWTVNAFLADLQARYSGPDAVLLWHSYPNLGIDDRNQWELLLDLPGGFVGVQNLVSAFQQNNEIACGLPYNPWDSGTAPWSGNISMGYGRCSPRSSFGLDDAPLRNAYPPPPPAGSPDSTIAPWLFGALGANFVNGDTLDGSRMNASAWWNASWALARPLIVQPEDGPTFQALEYAAWGWAYWGTQFAQPYSKPFVPPVDAFRWLERRHQSSLCSRWLSNHTDDVQMSFFNGQSFVTWENVWGIWNQISARDAALTARAATILRRHWPFFSVPSDDSWEPHTALTPGPAGRGVFASRWFLPGGEGPHYAAPATLFTIVDRGGEGVGDDEPLVPVPCEGPYAPGGPSNTSYYFDVYTGVQLWPEPLPAAAGAIGNATCALRLPVEPLGITAVLVLDPVDVGNTRVRSFLAYMANLTAVPLANFSTDNPYAAQQFVANSASRNALRLSTSDGEASAPLDVAAAGVATQFVNPTGRLLPGGSAAAAGAVPGDMIALPANGSWLYGGVTGTEIEPFQPNCIGAGDACERVDVQYPWEAVAVRVHAAVSLNVSAVAVDAFPVTNAMFAAFLAGSGYWPADDHRFLEDWSCDAGACASRAAGATTAAPMCTYPAGWDDKPVTHVSYEDARAACAFWGKRLPEDTEWQYAAQGTDGRPFPWGGTFDASRLPPRETGRALTSPANVTAHPAGASPWGVQDLVGNVWQLTNAVSDAHTFALLMRGGSYYAPQAPPGGAWYYPNPAQPTVTTHNKFLALSPGYDRAGTVGFRCAADL